MIDISVIIVSYNVKRLLQECLTSVQDASKNLTVEIWVVDNNSNDGSINMIINKFPDVNLIKNKKNYGFSTANNQAIRKAKGENILLLNPDTLIKEKCLESCLSFIQKKNNCGALGVQMCSAKGFFLPESKRGFPTAWTSLCKIVGINKVFSKSIIFNNYYLGHLDKDKNHSVDVLCGAFMWIKKSTLDRVGLLDETFFMYGEDIDLSYRIKKYGLENWYLGKVKILHYKGESTDKYNYNYIKRFYGAMEIFSKKHFPKKHMFYIIGIKILIIIHSIKLYFIRLILKKYK